jgi:hypothetical protein
LSICVVIALMFATFASISSSSFARIEASDVAAPLKALASDAPFWASACRAASDSGAFETACHAAKKSVIAWPSPLEDGSGSVSSTPESSR